MPYETYFQKSLNNTKYYVASAVVHARVWPAFLKDRMCDHFLKRLVIQ